MNARRLGYLAAILTLAASGIYFFVYLDRWEWNRALIAGVIFLAAEIALLGGLTLDHIRTLRAGQAPSDEARRGQPDPRVLARIRESAPTQRIRFAWLRPDTTNVFVPVLLGAGVVFSGLAWVMERIARLTAGRSMEQGLAVRLGSLQLPRTLISPEADPLLLFAPTRGRPT